MHQLPCSLVFQSLCLEYSFLTLLNLLILQIPYLDITFFAACSLMQLIISSFMIPLHLASQGTIIDAYCVPGTTLNPMRALFFESS